jgi:hypothetical protein
VREQAPLERLRDLTLNREPRTFDRKRDAVGDQLQESDIRLTELALRQHAYVEDADHGALDDQRDTEQRPDVLLPHQRVDDRDRRVVEVWDHDRLAGGGHPSREATPDRQAESSLDLLLEALGGPRHERPPVLLDQENSGGVRPEDLGYPPEQLGEQIIEVEKRERRVGDLCDVLELRDRVLLGRRGLFLVCRLWRAYSVEMDGSA